MTGRKTRMVKPSYVVASMPKQEDEIIELYKTTIDLSPPNIWCQSLNATLLVGGLIMDRRLYSLATRCGGKVSVDASVSTFHPRMHLRIADAGSLRCAGSVGDNGRNTWSMDVSAKRITSCC